LRAESLDQRPINEQTASRKVVITMLRTVVARLESTSFIPIFPKIATKDAARAERSA
jgi:hypothetical protein